MGGAAKKGTPIQAHRNAQDLLDQFLAAGEDCRAGLLLERLICEYADPVIKAVVLRKMEIRLDEQGSGRKPGLGSPNKTQQVELDAEDVYASSRLLLLEHLWGLKEAPEKPPIADFPAYVGQITLNAFALHMRRRYPQRHRLRQKLWEIMRGRARCAGLALWPGHRPGERLCGFQAWHGQPFRLTRNYERWNSDPAEFQGSAIARRDARALTFPDLVAQVLDWVGAPMEVDDLVTGLAELLGLHELEREDGRGAE